VIGSATGLARPGYVRGENLRCGYSSVDLPAHTQASTRVALLSARGGTTTQSVMCGYASAKVQFPYGAEAIGLHQTTASVCDLLLPIDLQGAVNDH
jgi:hypothetical protein